MKKPHCYFCNTTKDIHQSWLDGFKQKYSCGSCFKKHFRVLPKEEESELLKCINSQLMKEE